MVGGLFSLFFEKTQCFSRNMHLEQFAVVIKKSLIKQNPWLIESVFKAYSQSKQKAYDYMANAAFAKPGTTFNVA